MSRKPSTPDDFPELTERQREIFFPPEPTPLQAERLAARERKAKQAKARGPAPLAEELEPYVTAAKQEKSSDSSARVSPPRNAAKVAKADADNSGRRPKKTTARVPRVTVEEAAKNPLAVNAPALTEDAARGLQLTLFGIAPWASDQRAQPNDLARSALFTTRNKRVEREAYDNVQLFSYAKEVSIIYTGIELRAADDELVWLQTLEYAKNTPVGQVVSFTFYDLCTQLGWPVNGHYYLLAEQCLSRLKATSLNIKAKHLFVEALSLIDKFRLVQEGPRKVTCEISVDPMILKLFGGGRYSKVVWNKYRELSPTARRLFDYVASHREPYPLKLSSFQELCGSETKRAAKWKEQAKDACEELQQSGLVRNVWVDGDEVRCER